MSELLEIVTFGLETHKGAWKVMLTANDVQEATFNTVRFTTGYNIDEVDAFLDRVAAGVNELNQQIVALQRQLAGAGVSPNMQTPETEASSFDSATPASNGVFEPKAPAVKQTYVAPDYRGGRSGGEDASSAQVPWNN
jgi:DivIVA domain-containing protein